MSFVLRKEIFPTDNSRKGLCLALFNTARTTKQHIKSNSKSLHTRSNTNNFKYNHYRGLISTRKLKGDNTPLSFNNFLFENTSNHNNHTNSTTSLLNPSISRKKSKSISLPTNVQDNNNNNHINDNNLQHDVTSSSPPLQQIPEKVKQYKYKLISPNNNSLIQFPNNCGTDDHDLFLLTNLINESNTKQNCYKEMLNDPIATVYKKTIPNCDNIMIKSVCNIPYPKEVIYTAITDINIRLKWDTGFRELYIVSKDEKTGNEILYMSLISPSKLGTDRDLVQQRKIWKNFPNEHSHIMHFKSVTHPKCPVNKKYIRAETIISGYFLKDNGGSTIMCSVSQTDAKGSVPAWIINKAAPSSSRKWINSLLKGCEMVYKNTSTNKK